MPHAAQDTAATSLMLRTVGQTNTAMSDTGIGQAKWLCSRLVYLLVDVRGHGYRLDDTGTILERRQGMNP